MCYEEKKEEKGSLAEGKEETEKGAPFPRVAAMCWALHIFQCMENPERECDESKKGGHSLGKASWAHTMEHSGEGPKAGA